MVERMEISGYVVFTGFRDDVYSILSEVDLVLHTPLWEGFCYVVAEAMALARPVVCTDVSNIGEIMIDGETGYLARAKDPDDIARNTVKMLNNPDKNKFGDKGRQVIEDNFTFEKMIREIEDLILQ